MVRGLLTAVAAFVAEHRLQGTRASVAVAHGLNSCNSPAREHRLSSWGTWAQLLHGMWDLQTPGIELVSPPLAGTFFTTEPLEKPLNLVLTCAHNSIRILSSLLSSSHCPKPSVQLHRLLSWNFPIIQEPKRVGAHTPSGICSIAMTGITSD